jgi:hypothetical protein
MIMKAKHILSLLMLVTFVINLQAQVVEVKVTDLEKVTTTLTSATTSSSSTCNSSDFPVYQGSTLKEIDFEDITWVSVRHDMTPSDPNYVNVELTFTDGKTGIYEMVKHIRFTGTSSEGSFSLKVKDVNTVEVVHKR